MTLTTEQIVSKHINRIIWERMNKAMASQGRTFVWNPRSKYHVKRKIRKVRVTYGGNVELTFWTPLKGRLSKLFTIEPTIDCMEDFSIID